MTAKLNTGQRLLLAFPGKQNLPADHAEVFREIQPAGYTLFRHLNIDSPAQVLELTRRLQETAATQDLPPLLIATDQEGGQLMSVGEGTTQLPGNMAIGATDSTELAYRAGEILGREMTALGVNVVYAPVCDVNINPQNPVIGVRSFSENPEQVARLAAAMVTGIQSCGAIAVAKHFPGHGDTASDSHHGIGSLPYDLERLEEVEFKPFRQAFSADVKMLMTAHLALPKIQGESGVPATLSREIIQGLLRERLHYDGVVISDAMDMKAIAQGDALGGEAVKAIRAGVDILLLTSKLADQRQIFGAVRQAWEDGKLDRQEMLRSMERIETLRHALRKITLPDFSILNCLAHREVAREIAQRSVTLVRDQNSILPLRLEADKKIAVVLPESEDLTPADTSSYLKPSLADAIRVHHENVQEYVIPHHPSTSDIQGVLSQLKDADLVMVGTINACSNLGQALLVNQILSTGLPVIAIALRLPYDLAAYPTAPCFLATYSIMQPSLKAVVDGIFGKNPISGKLPVSIPGIHTAGRGVVLAGK